MMGQVYSNGFCNLSATGASDSSKGLFFSRDPRTLQPVNIRMNYSTRDGDTESKFFGFQDIEMWKKDVVNAPVNRRGWVVQERLLSRSNLHFGANQLFWECWQSRACETFPNWSFLFPIQSSNAYESYDVETRPQWSATRNLQRSKDPHRHSTPRKALEHWQQIADLYSKGALTRASDKLVAIGGLASLIHLSIGSEYIAGLWRIDIPYQLTWSVAGQDCPLPETYIAPSWSWAAVSREVIIPRILYTHHIPLIEIIDVHIELSPSNIYGQISHGYIVVKGCLASAKLCDTPPYSGSLGGKKYSPGMKDLVLNMNMGGTCSSQHISEVHWDCEQHAPASAEGTVFYLLAVLGSTKPSDTDRKNSNRDLEWTQRVDGLILEMSKSQLSKAFRRCGKFSLLMGAEAKEAFDQGVGDATSYEVTESGAWQYPVTII